MRSPVWWSSEEGFSLTELMVVIVIIGILALLALPRFMNVTTKAKMTEAKMMLKQVHTLAQTYYYEHDRYADNLGALGFEAVRLVSDSGIPVDFHTMLAPFQSDELTAGDGLLTLQISDALDPVSGDAPVGNATLVSKQRTSTPMVSNPHPSLYAEPTEQSNLKHHEVNDFDATDALNKSKAAFFLYQSRQRAEVSARNSGSLN